MRLPATVIVLALIPLVLFAIASYGKPQKPPVPIEQPTVLRAVKTDSFRAPVVATPITPVPVERPVVTEEARSTPVPGPPLPQWSLPSGGADRNKKKTRLAYRPDDICTRHGMHRVDYGRRWRCRK
jgi:hypothetical protein